MGKDQFGRRDQVGIRDRIASGPRGMGAGGGGGKKRRPQRCDAKLGRGAGQIIQGRKGHRHAGQGGAGGCKSGGIGQGVGRVGPGKIAKVEKQTQPVGKGGGQDFIGLGPFVQRDQGVTGAVERMGQAGGKTGRAAFGHGQNQRRRAGQHALGPDLSTLCQRGRKIDAAIKRVIGNRRMQT